MKLLMAGRPRRGPERPRADDGLLSDFGYLGPWVLIFGGVHPESFQKVRSQLHSGLAGLLETGGRRVSHCHKPETKSSRSRRKASSALALNLSENGKYDATSIWTQARRSQECARFSSNQVYGVTNIGALYRVRHLYLRVFQFSENDRSTLRGQEAVIEVRRCRMNCGLPKCR